MGPVPPDRLADALAGLDPADRALLELSLRRGLPDDEIGELLGSSGPAIGAKRALSLGTLAEAVGRSGDEAALEVELREAGDEVWEPGAPREEIAADEDAGAPAEGEPGAPPLRRVGSRRRRLVLLGLATVAVGIAIGVALATSRDDADDEGERGDRAGSAGKSEPQREQRERARPRTEAAPRDRPAPPRKLGQLVELESQIAGIEGTVAARLVVQEGRTRLALRAQDLTEQPKGGYEVWLFDSSQRAVSLARFRTRDFELDARLPDDFGSYRFIDVSLERRDDEDRGHSGASAFRAPVADLRR